MTDPRCRSVNPDGEPCTLARGHKRQKHSHRGGREWLHGVNVPAQWVLYDNGYMSEADWQIRERFGV